MVRSLGGGRGPGWGHDNRRQYSYLENPMDRGTWQATIHRVIKTRTWLKQISMHTGKHPFPSANCHFIDSRAMMTEDRVWWENYFLNYLINFNWRTITLQYCDGFCHTLTWITHIPVADSCWWQNSNSNKGFFHIWNWLPTLN